jgi:hypothetical protein
MERGKRNRGSRTCSRIGRIVCSTVTIFVLALHCEAASSELVVPVFPANVQQLLDQIGKWDGVTQEGTLEGPYEDPRQQAIPFGRISFYLTPWRAYMDTWPAKQFLASEGINFSVASEDAKATAKLLAESGFRSARVEFGSVQDDFPSLAESGYSTAGCSKRQFHGAGSSSVRRRQFAATGIGWSKRGLS